MLRQLHKDLDARFPRPALSLSTSTMKFFASFLLVILASVVVVQASVQPTPAPRVEKRQSKCHDGAAAVSLSPQHNRD